MRCLIIFLFFYASNLFSELNSEYPFDITFITDTGQTDVINFGDKLIYNQFKGTASWKDNTGDYSIIKCMGNYVSSEKSGTILNNYCRGVNKHEDKFWLTMNRNSLDYDGGIGKFEYIYGAGKFKNLKNTNCIYVVEISEEFSMLKQKCKIHNKFD